MTSRKIELAFQIQCIDLILLFIVLYGSTNVGNNYANELPRSRAQGDADSCALRSRGGEAGAGGTYLRLGFGVFGLFIFLTKWSMTRQASTTSFTWIRAKTMNLQ